MAAVQTEPFPISSIQSDVYHKHEIGIIDAAAVAGDTDLLAVIGYKQELNRTYSTLQIFGIAFSIMGLVPSISTTLGTGLMSGPAGLIWGWFVSGFFILTVGLSMSILASAIPTSGGLYYWTHYYAPDRIKVVLSFFIGCNNSFGLIGATCSVVYGFATEVLSAVYIAKDGDFNITNEMIYGVFVATLVLGVLVCCATSKRTAWLQAFSIYVNVFLIVLFLIAVPIGASKNSGFNKSLFVFGNFSNARDWPTGWSFMLSWMPAIWSINAFDSCVHMSEEAKNATRGVPIGIISSITICWVVGWILCIVTCFCIKDEDIESVLNTPSGQAMAQIIFDCLGKKWSVAYMSLLAFAQFLMSASLLTSSSRQIWAFARDDGLPFHSFIKVINPKTKVPLRAVIFAGASGLVFGLLILIGPTGAGALFSLGVASIYISWVTPVFLVLLPVGASKFIAGYFSLGRLGNKLAAGVSCMWIFYVIVLCMFPQYKNVDKETMNYTVVINPTLWIASVVYFYLYGHKYFSGPKSNLDSDEEESEVEIDKYKLDDKS